MLAALDVDYRADGAVAACVVFDSWTAAEATDERVLCSREPPAAYEPGQFYKRELPLLMAVLDRLPLPATILVDGYVWLPKKMPGLGAHLHEALDGRAAVIGVAKRAFRNAEAHATAVLRGTSARPLHVTAVGMDTTDAARQVEAMHGDHRIPTLLKRVDRLCRDTPL